MQIVSEGFFNRTDSGILRSRTVREVVWYVPEIKRWAKQTFEDQPLGRSEVSSLHIGEELLAYELK
jgi:hypothetical protein